MLISGHVIGHVIRLLIDSGCGLSNGCVRLLQWLVWWCIQILNCTILSIFLLYRNMYQHDFLTCCKLIKIFYFIYI